MDKEIVLFIFGAVGTVTWGIICWVVVRITARQDAHSERLGVVEKGAITSDLKYNYLKETLIRVEKLLETGASDHKDLDKKLTSYLLESADTNNQVLQQVLNKLVEK